MSNLTVQAKKLWWAGPLTIAAAIIGVLIVRLIAMAVLTPPFGPGLKMITLPIILTLILCSAAVVVYALVARFVKKPVLVYVIISAVFLVISFIPDIMVAGASMPGMGWPYSITLMVMHVVAGFITVFMLIKLTAVRES